MLDKYAFLKLSFNPFRSRITVRSTIEYVLKVLIFQIEDMNSCRPDLITREFEYHIF